MKKTTILMAMMVLLPSIMFAQSFLSEEQELEIKTEKYYWEEGNAFDETMAYHDALNNLTERIISDVVYQTKKRNRVAVTETNTSIIEKKLFVIGNLIGIQHRLVFFCK